MRRFLVLPLTKTQKIHLWSARVSSMYYVLRFYWKGSLSWLQLGIITDFHITFLCGFNNVTMANKGSVALWATTVLHFPATTCLAIFSSTTNSACKFRSTLCFFINFNWPKLDFLKWWRLVEIPAYLCGIYVTDKVGRRPTLCAGMIISGFACLITGLVPEGIPYLFSFFMSTHCFHLFF